MLIQTPDISMTMAFFAGVVSFLSPCILPMIPAYILYITGSSVTAPSKGLALRRTLLFVLGFTIIFVTMGSSVGFIGDLLVRYRIWVTRISGLFIIFFGLVMAGMIPLDLSKLSLGKKTYGKGNSPLGAFLLGVSFAAAWTPCFGPVLGAILMMASQGGVDRGFYLLLVYSLGMGLPFVLTALFIDAFGGFLAKAERHLERITKISGWVLVIFGLLVFFGQVTRIATYLNA